MKKKFLTKSAHSYFKKKFKNKSFVRAYEEVSLFVDIGIMITKARHQMGLSQKDFAKKLKTTQSVVSRIENGNQNLSLKMLSRIAEVLHCDLSISLKLNKLVA